MGLDQYLYARRFASNTPGFGDDIFQPVLEAAKANEFPTETQFGGINIEVCVGYWRKSNQVHQWFVDNCQGGVDDCRDAYVSREQLAELRTLCQQIIDDPDLASELLPTSSGFFFGSTDYDEYYLQDLRQTLEIIDNALTRVPDRWDFSYSSSW